MNKIIIICVILLEATALASVIFGDMDIYYIDEYETHLEAVTFNKTATFNNTNNDTQKGDIWSDGTYVYVVGNPANGSDIISVYTHNYIHMAQKTEYVGKELSWGFPFVVAGYIGIVIALAILTYCIFLYLDKRNPFNLKQE